MRPPLVAGGGRPDPEPPPLSPAMIDDDVITGIMRREGWDKFTDHPDDHGGPTKWGITLATFRGVHGMDATVEQLQALDEAGARAIYREVFLVRPGIGRIVNDEVRAVVLDAAVNHGPARAIKMLQRALGLPDDGVIGNVTLAALPHLDGRKLAVRVLAARARVYGRIITNDPKQATFAAGWMNRLAELLEGVA